MLRILWVGLGLKVLDVIRARIPRGVHGISPVVEVEGLVLVRLNILGSLLGHTVFDVHSDLVRDRGIFDELPRGKIASARA